ncbi:MAG: histidinol-phosphatase HisJ family protein [Actinobacteria bacterium]|nr:histidinol-phosphatase HisJ family protein [Actinomycetota bacterium]
MTDLPDYHIHTPFCGHAGGEMEQYVLAARELGLPEMGFADHLPLFHIDDPTLAMAQSDLPLYIDKVRDLQVAHSDYPVRLGIEADYISTHLDEVAKALARYEFDYVYGSVHFIGGWGIDQSRFKFVFERRDINEVYESYFGLVMDAARSGLFDVMTHIDVVKKYGHRPTTDMKPLYRDVARTLAKSDVAVELNASGLSRPVEEIYPSLEILEILHEYGVPITFGSDAHKPSQVGREFDKLLVLARSAGYTDYVGFEARKRIPRPLPSIPE